MKFPMKTKMIFNKTSNPFSNNGDSKQHSYTKFGQEISRVMCIMHWLSQFYYLEAKFGPLENKIKTIDISPDESFRKNSRVHPL